ncbi:MAG: helix-turn-helix transcriptional regulator [Pseudomonadota bacterium]
MKFHDHEVAPVGVKTAPSLSVGTMGVSAYNDKKYVNADKSMEIIDPDTAARPVFVLSEQYERFDGPWHAHRRAQLIYASEGLLTVRTTFGLWVVPPRRAVWIVPGEEHKGSAPKGFLLRTLYMEPGIVTVPSRCCVVTVDRLLDALLAEASTFGTAYPLDGPEQRLMQVILDRLPELEITPSYLPTPRDSRLVQLVTILENNPADSRSLEALAVASGMTGRTAARLFVKETGLTFARWRQQLRLLKAMQALSLGESVSNVAADVGYNDVSAFITVFKDAFGETPARYFR